MSTRLKWMLAVLAAVAALLLLDRPDPAGTVEVSAAAEPLRAVAQPAPAPPLDVAADGPIPDLFAAGAAPVTASEAQQAPPADAPERPAQPFALLGFREEGGRRAAWLLHKGEVASVRAGDVLDKRYQVLALGGDSVDIKDQRSGAALRIGFEDHQ